MRASRLVNRNVIAGRGRTSMRLEPELWEALHEICQRERIGLGELVRRIEQAGHAGHDPAGETHYDVLLVSAAFRDRSRVERARAVHDVLRAEFSAGLHAITLTLRTPEEYSRFG